MVSGAAGRAPGLRRCAGGAAASQQQAAAAGAVPLLSSPAPSLLYSSHTFRDAVCFPTTCGHYFCR